MDIGSVLTNYTKNLEKKFSELEQNHESLKDEHEKLKQLTYTFTGGVFNLNCLLSVLSFI